MRVRFRPHHFLCTLGFQGKGYSEDFVRGYQAIADRLRAEGGDGVEIEVTGATDSICEPCPNRRGELCETEARIRRLDAAHARVLGLEPGDVLTWGEAQERMAARFSVEKHREACADCSWRSLGVCETALVQLKKSRQLRWRKVRAGGAPEGRAPLIGLALAALVAASALAGPGEARAAVAEPAPMTSDGIPTNGGTRALTPELPGGSILPPVDEKPSASAPRQSAPPANVGPAAPPVLDGATSVSAAGPIEDGTRFIDEIHQQIKVKKRSRTAESIAEAYRNLGKERYSAVLSAAERIGKDALFADYGPYLKGEASLRLARFRLGRKDTKGAVMAAQDAFKRFAELYQEFPSSPFAEDAFERMAEAELLQGRIFVQRGWYTQSQKVYARAFQRLIDAKKILRTPLEDVQNYAMACAKSKNRDCFAWTWQLVDTFPGNSQEMQAIAKYTPEVVKLKNSAEYAPRMITKYSGAQRDEERFDEAFTEYMEADYGDAADKFTAFLEEFPKSEYRHRARYWLAKTLEKDGDKAKAQTMYEVLLSEAPLTYYGILASMALGRTPVEFIDATLPVVKTEEPFLYPDELNRLERAEKLLAAGAEEAASSELRGILAKRVHDSRFLMYLATLNHQASNYLTSFRVLTELFNRGYMGVNSSHSIRLIFPLVYQDLIRKHAEEQKIDPILVLSLMKQESAFSSGAVSWAGAMGLMQIMPLTAVDTDPKIQIHQLTDAETNVRLGTTYVARVLRQMKGNIVYTLAGYNAGPGRTRQWQREFEKKYPKTLGMLEFIELIPYKETREYVGSIIRNYYWYTYRLNGKLLTTLDYFWGVPGPFEHPTSLGAQSEAQAEQPLRHIQSSPNR